MKCCQHNLRVVSDIRMALLPELGAFDLTWMVVMLDQIDEPDALQGRKRYNACFTFSSKNDAALEFMIVDISSYDTCSTCIHTSSFLLGGWHGKTEQTLPVPPEPLSCSRTRLLDALSVEHHLWC